jgi:ubiquitin-conjugating enzyme E2 D
LGNSNIRRLKHELSLLNISSYWAVESIEPVFNEFTDWFATIIGPKDSPFEGGKFVVHIDFSDFYPFKSPKVRFITKFHHIIVEKETGKVCDNCSGIENYWTPFHGSKFVI